MNKTRVKIEPSGFLAQFIQDKIESYKESPRKGTPAGQPIRFSASKNAACVLRLTSLSLKEIAKKTGISPDYLRLLTAKKNFKACIESYADEFVDLFVYEFEQRNILPNKVEDIELYSSYLSSRIQTELIKKTTTKKIKYPPHFLILVYLLRLFSRHSERRTGYSTISQIAYEKLVQKFAHDFYWVIIELLKKVVDKNIRGKTYRKEALEYLDILKEFEVVGIRDTLGRK